MKLVFGEKVLLFNNFWTLGLRIRNFNGKKTSARFSELTSTGTEGHFEGKKLSNKTKDFLFFFVIWASNFLNSSKTSGTFVKTAFHLYKWSICSESFFCQKKLIFSILSGSKAGNFRTSCEVFSALLSKLHFASLEDHSDVVSEQFLCFEPLRDMSSKCWNNCPKNCGTVFSNLHSSCTDEAFERKLVFEKNLFTLYVLFQT